MQAVAWIALAGLLLQPAVAVLCEARCLTAVAPAQMAAAPSCHEASGTGDGSQTLVAARLDACAHADAATTPQAPLLRDDFAVVNLPHTRPTRVASAPAFLTTPAPASIRHRRPDDSSGTLRV